jgi:hypothetical protein
MPTADCQLWTEDCRLAKSLKVFYVFPVILIAKEKIPVNLYVHQVKSS